MSNIAYPFHFDSRGRTATADPDTHVRDLVEQVLFTAPGERVNRPDFGSGLLRLVFNANSPELEAALDYSIRASLQRWLGDLIDLQPLEIVREDSAIFIGVRYVVRLTGQSKAVTFEVINP
jgi:phage baseplate assembly protein W